MHTEQHLLTIRVKDVADSEIHGVVLQIHGLLIPTLIIVKIETRKVMGNERTRSGKTFILILIGEVSVELVVQKGMWKNISGRNLREEKRFS